TLEFTHGVQHRERFLRRRGGVEIHEIRIAGEQGEVGTRSETRHDSRSPTRICPFSTFTAYTGSGSVAGSRRAAPVRQSKIAPCQAHSMRPFGSSRPSEIGNSWCVQLFPSAWISPPWFTRHTRSPAAVITPSSVPSGRSLRRATGRNGMGREARDEG